MSFLVLSILPEPAGRIFAGTKTYELRKVLPKEPFDYVFLYSAVEAGLIGYFRAGRVITLPVTALWEHVTFRATSEDKFLDYFNGWQVGHAIEILEVVRFSRVEASHWIGAHVHQCTAPQGFLRVPNEHQLFPGLQQLLAQAPVALTGN